MGDPGPDQVFDIGPKMLKSPCGPVWEIIVYNYIAFFSIDMNGRPFGTGDIACVYFV